MNRSSSRILGPLPAAPLLTVLLLAVLPLLMLLLAMLLLTAAPLTVAHAQAPAPGVSEDVLSGFDDPLPGGGSPSAPGTDDLERGFSEEFPGRPTSEGGAEEPAEPARSFWELDGFLRLDGAYNYAHEAPQPGQTDYRGLSKLRVALRLELALELGAGWRAFVSGQAFHDYAYEIHGEEHYSPQVLDAYQQEGELREAWVLGTPLPSLDLKVGRQVVVWGKSDNIRVVDVLNPLDLREPGLTDLEDLRLPVTMTRLDYYLGDWSLSGIAVHEIRFNKEPVPGSDYFPFSGQALPLEQVPTDGGANTEYGASLGGIFSGWDLAFYWAQIFNDDGTLADADGNLANGLQPQRRHARLHMAGAAANVALGNWLLKTEAAQFTGLRFIAAPERTFTRLDGLLGAEYTGFTDTTLAFEAADRHLLGHTAALEAPPDNQPEDVNQYVLSYRGTYLREKLDVVAVLSAFGAHAEQGTLQRYQLTYELATALDLTGGVVIYTPGDGRNFLLVNAQDNDRLFFDLKWSF